MGTSNQVDMTWKSAASPQSATGRLMVGFGSWLRTPALTKGFPSLSPGLRRGFFWSLHKSALAYGGDLATRCQPATKRTFPPRNSGLHFLKITVRQEEAPTTLGGWGFASSGDWQRQIVLRRRMINPRQDGTFLRPTGRQLLNYVWIEYLPMEKPRPRSTGLLRFQGWEPVTAGGHRHRKFNQSPDGTFLRASASAGRLLIVEGGAQKPCHQADHNAS